MKKISVLLITILILTGIFFVLNKKTNIVKLDNVEIKENNKVTFAMYKENDEGEYDEIIDTDVFPTYDEGYELNIDKSICINSDGNEINDILDYDKINNKVLVDTSQTSFCYLYFDIYRIFVVKNGVAQLPYTTLSASVNTSIPDVLVVSTSLVGNRAGISFGNVDLSDINKVIIDVEIKSHNQCTYYCGAFLSVNDGGISGANSDNFTAQLGYSPSIIQPRTIHTINNGIFKSTDINVFKNATSSGSSVVIYIYNLWLEK